MSVIASVDIFLRLLVSYEQAHTLAHIDGDLASIEFHNSTPPRPPYCAETTVSTSGQSGTNRTTQVEIPNGLRLRETLHKFCIHSLID